MPPVPIEGAALDRLANGIEVRLPHVDPEQAWRESWRGLLWTGVSLVGFLGIIFLAFGAAALFDEVGSKAWQDSLFILLSMFIVAVLFGGLALIEYVTKLSALADYADRTPIAVGVRSGMLYRKYASGREETWSAAEITAVVVSALAETNLPLGVHVQLTQGKPVHLHGRVKQIPGAKLQIEGLRWLADELGKALGLVTEPVRPTTPVSPDEAIIDFAARPVVEANFRSS
jgi:hypothetical protein